MGGLINICGGHSDGIGRHSDILNGDRDGVSGHSNMLAFRRDLVSGYIIGLEVIGMGSYATSTCW